MQGFALKRPGSGLKSLVHVARGAPPRNIVQNVTILHRMPLKRDFAQKWDIFLGGTWNSSDLKKSGLKSVSDDFLTWGGAKVRRIYVFNICC